MSQLWAEGSHAGANLTEASFPEGKGGAVEVHLKFDVQGAAKMVYLSTSDRAWPYTEKKLARLGWNGSTEKPEFTASQNLELNCRIEPYEGKDREKWDFFADTREAAPADKRRVIEARFKSSNKPPPRPGSAPAKPSSVPPRPSSPPPRPGTAPTKPDVETFGMNEAWAAFEKAKMDNNAFWASIELVENETRRTHTDFTAEDWKGVVSAGSVPF